MKQIVPNELIVLEWEGTKGLDTRVEMNFVKSGETETIVKISETGWRENQGDLDDSYRNCMGWTQMLCAMKAYVEYGINLRKGAFEGLYSATEHHGAKQSA